jgi:hypothetical protein
LWRGAGLSLLHRFHYDSARTPQRASSGLRALPLLARLMPFHGLPDAPAFVIHALSAFSRNLIEPEKEGLSECISLDSRSEVPEKLLLHKKVSPANF